MSPNTCKDLQIWTWRCGGGQTSSLSHLEIEVNHYVMYFPNVSYFYLRLYYGYKYLLRSNIADFLCGPFNIWKNDQRILFLTGNGSIVFFSYSFFDTMSFIIRNAVSLDLTS